MFKPTQALMLLPLAIALGILGCADYSIRNAHIVPSYVCSGDSMVPYASWEYSGPRGRLKIATGSGEVVCEGGARTGYCAFTRPLTSADTPLKAMAYKGGDKKGEEQLTYRVLSAPALTEPFQGSYEFSDPYQKCLENKVTYPDGRVETTTQCYDVRSTSQVGWPINAEWFSSGVQTRAVKYSLGFGSVRLSGPGLNQPVSLNVGGATAGNNAHPGGLWTGEFNPPIEFRTNELDGYQPDFRLTLTVACQ